ncbi:hypothetical protein [Streptomyces sp. NPDC005890]|uniref:hypothetical protein n=1 Tax=Streptomyces sp. NPDC005890 TaxID=3154568 RepID=UPI0033C701D3
MPRFAREAGLADEGRFPFGRGTSLRHLTSGGDPYDGPDGWDGGTHDGYDHGGGGGDGSD